MAPLPAALSADEEAAALASVPDQLRPAVDKLTAMGSAGGGAEIPPYEREKVLRFFGRKPGALAGTAQEAVLELERGTSEAGGGGHVVAYIALKLDFATAQWKRVRRKGMPAILQ